MKNLLLVLAVALTLTGCNCLSAVTVIDNGDPEEENAMFGINPDQSCAGGKLVDPDTL